MCLVAVAAAGKKSCSGPKNNCLSEKTFHRSNNFALKTKQKGLDLRGEDRGEPRPNASWAVATLALLLAIRSTWPFSILLDGPSEKNNSFSCSAPRSRRRRRRRRYHVGLRQPIPLAAAAGREIPD